MRKMIVVTGLILAGSLLGGCAGGGLNGGSMLPSAPQSVHHFSVVGGGPAPASVVGGGPAPSGGGHARTHKH
ncbi:MAG TPA: hypothetical protein VEW74_02940 [Candidatus Nitrosotalea sp.]|nr:hypothetical protein [Candidatus Nitrosotalea sp.]